MAHPADSDDCRADQQDAWQMFVAQVQVQEEQDAPGQDDHGDQRQGPHSDDLAYYAGKWICPYCGKAHSQEQAYFRGCCGESSAHMLEPDTKEWLEFIMEGK